MGHYQSWESSPKYGFTEESLNLGILSVYRAHRGPASSAVTPYAGRVPILPRIRLPCHVKLEATNFLKTFYSRKLLQSLEIVNLKSPQYTDRTRTVMWKCKRCVSQLVTVTHHKYKPNMGEEIPKKSKPCLPT